MFTLTPRFWVAEMRVTSASLRSVQRQRQPGSAAAQHLLLLSTRPPTRRGGACPDAVGVGACRPVMRCTGGSILPTRAAARGGTPEQYIEELQCKRTDSDLQ